ncbi:MAG: ribonuclease H-like domain-containing protein [Armatimonadetes bacterium]|nr:ribonuclease H-like domain-containing protein [Armatimonadota bacterium]
MLTSTYVHVRGIDAKSERSLWEQGALSWRDFLGDPKRFVTEKADIAKIEKSVTASVKALDRGVHQYFANRLPRREHWRAFPEFRDSLVYLDVETEGSFREDTITMVGLYDGVAYMPFIKGENLVEFPDAISMYSTVVTFFGSGFDLPMLAREFPSIELDQLHIDLCPTMRRLGYRGGLKSIERQFGIERSTETRGLTGRDAVILWRQYLRGRDSALDTLVQYNKEDVVNLERLMEATYSDLRLMVMG